MKARFVITAGVGIGLILAAEIETAIRQRMQDQVFLIDKSNVSNSVLLSRKTAVKQ